jgi:hypothetical protein
MVKVRDAESHLLSPIQARKSTARTLIYVLSKLRIPSTVKQSNQIPSFVETSQEVEKRM